MIESSCTHWRWALYLANYRSRASGRRHSVRRQPDGLGGYAWVVSEADLPEWVVVR